MDIDMCKQEGNYKKALPSFLEKARSSPRSETP
jgi:hypothetical protein